ncbi:MAG: hypothetical protein AAFO75_08240, partial [Pseudomonadota bacterium]
MVQGLKSCFAVPPCWRSNLATLTCRVGQASIVLLAIATCTAHGADITARDFALKLKTATVDAPLDVTDQDISFLDLSNLNFKHAILTGADL